MAAPVVLDRARLGSLVERLGEEIARDHPDGVVLVGVLKGSLIFLSDLARAVRRVPVVIDFMAISRFAPGSGRVKILHDLQTDITGLDVVLVEDMVDTGLTLTYLLDQLRPREPRRLDVCTLLDRAVRRIVPVEIRYRGMEIGDVFALGYGLHFRDLYRNLPFIVEGDRDVLHADPARYVPELYGPSPPDAAPGET